MSYDRDPQITIRLPQEQLDALDAAADRYDLDRSKLARMFIGSGLESVEDVALTLSLNMEREQIIEDANPIDMAGGFAKRVEDDFRKRLKNRYEPKWLVSKSESYYKEAEMLAEKVPKHPDAPPIQDGEFEQIVDDVIHDVLEASQLSDWTDRYENRFGALGGVESGREARKFALTTLRTALDMENDLEPFRAKHHSTRHVEAGDLPELAANDLPESVTLEDVADAAVDLAERGWTSDDVETDPTAFDPFGMEGPALESDNEDVIDVESTTGDVETDGGPVEPVADGGDNEAILAYNEASEENDVVPTEPGAPTAPGTEEPGTDGSTAAAPENMEHNVMSRSELVESVAEYYTSFGANTKAKGLAREALRDGPSGKDEFVKAVEKRGLDVGDVLDDAVEAAEEVDA